MAVTVVGRDESVKRRVTHKRCGSILEYYDQDVREAIHTDYGGGTEFWRYVVCPECNTRYDGEIVRDSIVEVK